MNAFTTRETTTFYVKVLDQQLEAALELLSDLFYRSRFDSKEVEKEKQVVLEEIRMVQDDPEDLVQELHMKHTLGSHPWAGRFLVRLRGFRRSGETICSHTSGPTMIRSERSWRWRQLYWRRLEQLLARYFSSSHKGTPIVSSRGPPEVSGGVLVKRKTLEQVHLCLGLQGLAAGHKDRYAAHALNGVLGGSVSSRLFQEVREKRGLVTRFILFSPLIPMAA